MTDHVAPDVLTTMLDRLREAAGDDDEFVTELMETFVECSRASASALRDASAADAVAREAHALKGACLNVGASDLASLCATVESAARSGESVTAADVEALATHVDALCDIVDAELGRRAAA